MPDGVEEVLAGSARYRLRREWSPWRRWIDAPPGDPPPTATEPRAHAGRTTQWSFRPPGAPSRVLVRRYLRGGALRWMGGRYLWPSRPFREWDVLERTAAAGLRVPRPIYAGAERRGPFWRLTLTTEELEGYGDALAFFRAAPPRHAREAARRIGAALGALLHAGIWHPDLHIGNVLVRERGDEVDVALVDFDRARWIGPRAWSRRRRLLARLERSLAKRDPRGYCLSRADRLRLRRALAPCL